MSINEQRAALLGVRAAMREAGEETRCWCDKHGFYDEHGNQPRLCKTWCKPDDLARPFAGDYLEEALHSLTYDDRKRGTKTHAVATRMRKAKRKAMAVQLAGR